MNKKFETIVGDPFYSQSMGGVTIVTEDSTFWVDDFYCGEVTDELIEVLHSEWQDATTFDFL